MTDEQIIKALKCLTKDNASCDDRLHCYFMFKEPSCFNCYHEVAKNALDLVNRQKAEIEKLETELADARYLNTVAADDAIKEFAKEVSSRISEEDYNYSGITEFRKGQIFSQVLKEMTEGDNDKLRTN